MGMSISLPRVASAWRLNVVGKPMGGCGLAHKAHCARAVRTSRSECARQEMAGSKGGVPRSAPHITASPTTECSGLVLMEVHRSNSPTLARSEDIRTAGVFMPFFFK